MQKLTIACLVVVAGCLATGQAHAQGQGRLPASVEVRGGFAFPSGDWNEEDVLETGTGFGVAVQFQVTSLLGAYLGWERYSFGIGDESDPELADLDADAVDSGFRGGLHLGLPIRGLAGVSPFLLGGVLYHQTEFGNDSGSLSFESDSNVGYELGGGVVIPLGQVISFTPAVRWRSHSAEFDGSADPTENNGTTVSYVTVDVGLRFGF